MPSPPGVIGTTAAMLASPKHTMSPSMLERSRRTRGRNTHSAAASSNQLAAAQPSTRNSSGLVGHQVLEPAADVAHRVAGAVLVLAQPAGDPAQHPLRSLLALHQPEDDRGRDDP